MFQKQLIIAAPSCLLALGKKRLNLLPRPVSPGIDNLGRRG